MKYNKLEKEIAKAINDDRKYGRVNPYRFDDENVIRRYDTDKSTLVRPAFVRDSEKILHLPIYSRYADKTQVFSFYKNDDISRRALHVQLVSRISRNIGALLGLNCELIEAIALGHDMGHTPFGHAGENYLNDCLYEDTGLYFNHNVHSVRVFDTVYGRNISLQTLDGILCHNGEFEVREFHPVPLTDFDEFDEKMRRCYTEGKSFIDTLVPSTLEGCVVRISDMIAYIGKDRQDAVTARLIDNDTDGFTDSFIGARNAEIINNLIVDIVNNSYGKDYICMSDEGFNALKIAKKENYEQIYKNKAVSEQLDTIIKPKFKEIYKILSDDYVNGNENSPIFRHHIAMIEKYPAKNTEKSYRDELTGMIVSDYIASMTDDYFIELCDYLGIEKGGKVDYKSYFDDLKG
ncbi:MAG: HD domain-containing protein [Ruminococcus sp.]|nr:HD domain-containing protein [Ruminococcus sp.]